MLRGRENELLELARGATGARDGRPCIHALVGEPGIGKTALASEAAQRAAELGVHVAWGRAWEAGGAAAYWPWRQLIAALPATAETAQLAERWSKSGAGDFSAADPALAQIESFEAVVGALQSASHTSPLLCLLDDLHAADDASLGLLAFLVRSRRLNRCSWLLTWRDAEAEEPRVREVIAAIARESTVLPLRPLSEPDSAQLISDTLGPVDTRTAETLFRATSGNPLFLLEVLRSLALRHADPRALNLEQVPVTGGVDLVVRQRSRQLEAETLAMLEAASVVGRELDLPTLTGASGLSPVRARELASALCVAGFLREKPADAWSFNHALVRDALYRALTPDRRRALHLRVATALDLRIAQGQGGLARLRAHHGLHALPGANEGEVARWAIAAAAEARAQCAYEDAVSVLENAREKISDQRAKAELLVALGWAHGDAGRTLGMRESLDQAIRLARSLGDAHLFARAVIGYGSRYVLGDIRTDLLPLLDEAEAALSSERGGLHARLLARRAAAMTPAEDSEPVLEMARKALLEVGHDADRRTFIDVAVAAGSAFGDFAEPFERSALNTRLVLAARAEQDHVLELRGLGRLVTDYLEVGDLARADAALGEWTALCAAVRPPGFVWMAPLFRSMRRMIGGGFAEAHADTDEAASLASRVSDENARRTIAVHRHWLYLLQDDLPSLRAHEPETLAALGSMESVCALVRVSTLGRFGQWDAMRAELAHSIPPALPRLHAVLSLTTLGEAIAALGPTPHSHEVRARLERRPSSNPCWGLFGLVCLPPVTMVLGQLARAENQPEQANAFFAAALARTEQMGARAHQAWVCFRWGEASANPEHLQKAEELAEELGMPGLAERARAALGQMPGPRPTLPPLAGMSFQLVREGEGWRVTRGEVRTFLRDIRGMGMLAQLVAKPNEEIHSLALATDAGPHEVIDAGDGGELLDDTARAAYQRRARELAEAVEEARSAGNAAAEERAQAELDVLARELSRAFGLGGRKRRAGVASERARVVVQRRIREAIRRLAQADPELGAHLDTCVRTGILCSYGPLRSPKSRR